MTAVPIVDQGTIQTQRINRPTSTPITTTALPMAISSSTRTRTDRRTSRAIKRGITVEVPIVVKILCWVSAALPVQRLAAVRPKHLSVARTGPREASQSVVLGAACDKSWSRAWTSSTYFRISERKKKIFRRSDRDLQERIHSTQVSYAAT